MRLTEAELATMRAEHAPVRSQGRDYDICGVCITYPIMGGDATPVEWPCDAARLLAHFAPGPVPHLAGIQVGLLGPVDESEFTPSELV